MTTQRTTQGKCSSLIGFLFILSLAVLVTGCGGGGDSGNNSGDNPPPGGGGQSEQADVVAGPVAIVTLNVGDSSGNLLSESARTVTLDGSQSHAGTGKPDTYSWEINSKPPASQAVLLSNNGETTSFVADKKGTYVVQLIVTAGGVSSERAITIVDAKNDGELFVYNHTGLNPDCVACHDGVKEVNIKGETITVVTKIGDHMAASNKCAACHSTLGFLNVPFVDHKEVFGKCSECHNGVTAITKSQFHQETTGECDECHNTRSFVDTAEDGSYDHSGIDRACTACHNGKVAIGKFEGHVETTVDCGFCHTTETFANAYVDHSGFKESGQICADCHNGTNAIGTPDNHPAMSVDCGVCHDSDSNPLTFRLPDGIFNHGLVDSISQPCGVCHDGTFAKGKNFIPDHIETTADCANCHNTVAFTPAFEFDHSQFPTVTGDRCDRCHGNSNTGMDANHITIGDGTVTLNIPPDLVGAFPTLDCAACHTPGTFASGVFNHDYLNDTTVYTTGEVCSTCHDEIHEVGKPPNHIETTAECDTCHHSFDTFSGGDMDHTTITSNCASCHDGDTAIGKPTTNHVPVDASVDCSTCHVGGVATPSFIPAGNFAHQPETIPSEGCIACHNGQYTTSTDKLLGKPRRTHIPTQADCDTCHTTTAYTDATFDHSNITRGCEGCHNGNFTTADDRILSKADSPTTHVPTDQDCYLCHNFAEGWKASVQTEFKHTGITGDCYTCHDGSPDFVAVGALGVGDDPNTPDPHPTITVDNTTGVQTPDCVVCHSSPSVSNPDVTFATHFVDHSGITGNCTDGCHSAEKEYAVDPSKHSSPTNGNDCESCHIGGGTWTEAVFAHTPEQLANRTCESCHNGTDATGKADKLALTGTPHVDTTEDCKVCHNTTSFAGAKFNHQGITTGCIDCHDGLTAIGKPQNHVPTNDDCYVCHKTTGFIPGTFAHTSAQISGKECQSCHDGVFATGKQDKTGTPHIDTTQDCGVCHTTDTFVGGIFDHSNIGNQSCVSCHNGTDAKGQPTTGHIDSAKYGLDCDRCHTAGGSFTGATFDHNNINQIGDGTCKQCHSSGGGATPQPPSGPNGHFETTVDCDACHNTNGWSDQGTFDHCPGSTGNATFDKYNECDLNGSHYPGDHVDRNGNPRFACTECHTTNNANYVYYSYDERNNTNYGPTCAGCHANRYSRGADGHSGLTNDLECGNSCHREHHTVTDSRFN